MDKIKILENKKNMCILNYDNLYQLTSYGNIIAKYDTLEKKLYLNNNTLDNKTIWNYSQTTLKSLKNFINNYTIFKYNSLKDFAENILKNKSIYKIGL